MINAGVKIKPFNGLQQWSPEDNAWVGIGVEVVYPKGQTPDDNPIRPGDRMIEPSGNVWQVLSIRQEGDIQREFILTIQLESDTPSQRINPGFGSVTRGGIITPVNGLLAAYWDVSLVDDVVGRIAQYVTLQNAPAFWTNDVLGQDLGMMNATEEEGDHDTID